MSYILDALRRADAERERGGVPGLHAQPALSAAGQFRAAPTTRARRIAYAGGAAVLALLLAFFAWHAGRREVLPPVVASPQATATVAAPAPVVTPAPTSIALVPTSPATPPALPRENVVPAPVAAAATSKRMAVAASPASRPLDGAVPTSVRDAADDVKVPRLADLPEDIRRELPSIAIGGSIYSASPASRVVIVNGQLYHEGDALAPGLVLQQIRLKSAVLAYRGYRYGVTF